MKLPISWLHDYIDQEAIGNLHDFAEKMTMSGSKVEKIHHLGAEITNVVCGRIEEILPHPDANKLVITKINIGSDDLVQIVTGATNLTAGDYIPAALHGANLANGLKIKKGKIRGVESNGMLCSVEELGYTKADFPEAPEDGIYIFDSPQELGSDARAALGILQDVLEFEITSNRPDCYSIIGLAREAAATLNVPLVGAATSRPLSAINDIKEYINVEISNPNLCKRYIAAVVKNVKIAPSPQWLRTRLIACGLRPVNNIVDITNYVMLKYGQPMHAFDIRAIDGGKIIVRNAVQDEKIVTLDGEERGLDAETLVIADSTKAVGIAGIKGGEFSKILDDTTTILFESANFYGPNIRQSSKKLGLRTDSSGKYEKGLDPELALACINHALELVEQFGCGDVIDGMVDVYPTPRVEHKLNFDPAKIAALIGINIDLAGITAILSRLGISVDGTAATIPTFRSDITIWQDLAEEVARLYGYDNIPAVIASSSNAGGKNAEQKMVDTLKNTMVALGYSEMLTYAFESPKVFDKLLIPETSYLRKVVRISNPLGEDTSIMRTSSLNAVLTALSTNYNRRNPEARLFELVKRYLPNENPAELPKEENFLVAGGFGNMEYCHIKGVVENLLYVFGIEQEQLTFAPTSALAFMHPGRTAMFSLNGEGIGFCGQVHPQVLENYEIGASSYISVINFDALRNFANLEKKYKSLPRYPYINRDIAVVVKTTVNHGQIEAEIKKNGSKLLKNVQLFDIYEGKNLPEGTKSMAYALTFGAPDRTLTDEDATKAITKILTALEQNLEAQLRS
ncbi:MAG: phenylalanine--tRNA ligase subunit beta [Defluviitaleaceae bacterium]|nr:phenylalanine--tRNA ligase subunit beta [Defluviitaleaceae bacterium]